MLQFALRGRPLPHSLRDDSLLVKKITVNKIVDVTYRFTLFSHKDFGPLYLGVGNSRPHCECLITINYA